jgi:hypothetical protein
MPLHDLNDFLKLSSVLNYNLSAASLNRYNVLTYILRGKSLHPGEKDSRRQKARVMDALNYLFSAYSDKRRRLGPMAVLHPLRATALYAHSQERLSLVNLLSMMFHDVLEDIKPVDFEVVKWREMESLLFGLLKNLTPREERLLTGNLLALTRVKSESYFQYIGRLLEYAVEFPDLVSVKLADRLDNTLDMRIDLQDPLEGIDFFKDIFQILFVNNFGGHEPNSEHAAATAMNGARRLHQLFKNAVLMSLIRQKRDTSGDTGLNTLFDALADASLREAQRTFIHLVGYHHRDLEAQRELLLEAMDYCYSGRSDLVTQPDSEHAMDGLFSTYFDQTSKEQLTLKLDLLYQNKPLMIQASIAFIVIFLSFLNQEDFYVKGISPRGMEPTAFASRA